MKAGQIEIHNLSKSYGSLSVLRDISCTFEEGLTHIILGSSGCGKSTFLRLIMGLISPDSGKIKIGGLEVDALSQRTFAQKMGYLVQDGGLFAHLDGFANISIVAKNIGWSAKQMKTRANELLSLVDLPAEVLKKFPKDLSGGQKQKLSLIRALMLDPPILILDEPFVALDPLLRFFLEKDLKRIFNRLKKTVLMVTHDLQEASFFGHTVTLLQSGIIEQQGNYADLVQNPASEFVREFVNAQMAKDR